MEKEVIRGKIKELRIGEVEEGTRNNRSGNRVEKNSR